MPVLKVRDPNTGQYVPLLAGGPGGDYVLKSGDTMSGELKLLGSSHTYMRVSAPATHNKGLNIRTDDVPRWVFISMGSTQVAGGLETDDLVLARYNDAGSQLGNAMVFKRATGEVQIPGLTTSSESQMVPASGWTDYGAAYAGMYATKHAGMVTIEGLIKPTGSLAVSAGTAYTIATLPVGFRPAHQVMAAGIATLSGGTSIGPARVDANATGNVQWVPVTGGTITTAGWVGFAITFRQGN